MTMNFSNAKPLIALVLALVSTAACAAPTDAADVEDGDSPEKLGQSAEALTCQPTITAAAITQQIVSIAEPITLTVELVTITAKPYRLQATGLTFPAGFVRSSLATTSCTDTGTGSYKCRHRADLLAVGAKTGTGAYTMSFTGIADAGSGCWNGGTTSVPFSLTTESFASSIVVTGVAQ